MVKYFDCNTFRLVDLCLIYVFEYMWHVRNLISFFLSRVEFRWHCEILVGRGIIRKQLISLGLRPEKKLVLPCRLVLRLALLHWILQTLTFSQLSIVWVTLRSNRALDWYCFYVRVRVRSFAWSWSRIRLWRLSFTVVAGVRSRAGRWGLDSTSPSAFLASISIMYRNSFDCFILTLCDILLHRCHGHI